jgi:hypothetical protein
MFLGLQLLNYNTLALNRTGKSCCSGSSSWIFLARVRATAPMLISGSTNLKTRSIVLQKLTPLGHHNLEPLPVRGKRDREHWYVCTIRQQRRTLFKGTQDFWCLQLPPPQNPTALARDYSKCAEACPSCAPSQRELDRDEALVPHPPRPFLILLGPFLILLSPVFILLRVHCC